MYAAAHISSLVVGNSTAAYYGFNSTMAIAHIQRDAAAPSVNSFVTGNSAAVHGKCAIAIHIHTTTAIVTCFFHVVIADLTAVHLKRGVLYLHTCAIITHMISTDLAAVHEEFCVDSIRITAHSYTTAFYARTVGDTTLVPTRLAIAEHQFAPLFDHNNTAKGTILAGFCNTLAIQAEVEGFTLPNFNRIFRCHVIGQVDVGGVIAIVCNVCVAVRSRATPRLPLGHLCVAVVVILAVCHTTAEMVGVHRHFRCGGGDHHAEQGTQAQGQSQE